MEDSTLDDVIKGLEFSWEYIRERPNPTATPKAMAMHNIKKAIELLEAKQTIKLFNEHEYITRYTGDALQLMPDVMQELVRCKNCKFGEACRNGRGEHGVWCYNGQSANMDWVHDPDWFCADGERKDI